VVAGARRLLRWEQRMVLGPTSGQVVTSAETKVKLSVSAAELQQETHLSDAGLQYMLAVAGSRCAHTHLVSLQIFCWSAAACHLHCHMAFAFAIPSAVAEL
jgi:hypothetical protein